MAVSIILDRLRKAVQPVEDYLVPVDHVPDSVRAGAAEVVAVLQSEGADAARRRVEELHASGDLDQVTRLSALQVIAASPGVRDLAEASRLASQQEYVALQLGGPELASRLASADRHRGVVAFLMGRHEVAIDWFTRAFERERSAENVGNVLATLLALGERSEANDLLETVRSRFAESFVGELESRITGDDDLRDLRR